MAADDVHKVVKLVFFSSMEFDDVSVGRLRHIIAQIYNTFLTTEYGPNNIFVETIWTKAIIKIIHVLHLPFVSRHSVNKLKKHSKSYCTSVFLLRKHQSTIVMILECLKDLRGYYYLSENCLTYFCCFLISNARRSSYSVCAVCGTEIKASTYYWNRKPLLCSK